MLWFPTLHFMTTATLCERETSASERERERESSKVRVGRFPVVGCAQQCN